MEKIHIHTNNAPKPGGPYSQVTTPSSSDIALYCTREEYDTSLESSS